MKGIVSAVVAAAEILAASAAGVKVSERFGYDAEDATANLQAALDSGLPEIIVDAKSGPWFSRPLVGRSNQTITFEKGAVIRAKRGEFRNRYTPLIRFSLCTNVVLRGADPRTCGFRMWREDYADKGKYEWSEWRHSISLLSCVNVTLEGIGSCESGGDGLYISPAGSSRDKTHWPPCRNITVRNCVFDRNYRQGISVIGVDGLLIEDTDLTNTWGTPPAAGIDFEPNARWEPLKNIVMRRCRVADNQGVGLDIAHQHFRGTSEPISMLFEDCTVDGNRHAFAYNNGAHDPDIASDAGTITVRRCTFRRSREGAVTAGRRVNCTGTVAFDGVTIEDCGTEKPDTPDIWLAVSGHTESAPDAFTFRDVTVKRPQERPAVSWMKRNEPYLGRPTLIDGAIRTVTAGKTETLTFDDAWRATNTPFHAVFLPPSLKYVPVSLENVAVIDPAPGAMRPCSPVFVRGSGRRTFRPFTFYADRPRDVRLHFMQTLIGKRDHSAAKPIEIYAAGGTNRLARLNPPCSPEGDVLVFHAPAAGFYDVQMSPCGNGLALMAADVPVALNATDGFLELVAAAGPYACRRTHRPKSHRLHFDVPEGARFECVFAGEGSETLSAEVFDPSGRSVWRTGAVDGFVRCQPMPEAGLWALEIGPPSVGGYEDHLVTLKGVPGWLFPDGARHWRTSTPPARAPARKYIGFSWDTQNVSPEEVLTNAALFADTVLDGIVLNAYATDPATGKRFRANSVLDMQPLTDAMLADQVPVLRGIIRHKGLGESLLSVFHAPQKRLDWRDDAAWAQVASNMAALVRTAKAGGLKGFFGDQEDYHHQRQFELLPGDPPWDKVAQLARRRGRQVFGEMFANFPDAVFLDCFGLFAADFDLDYFAAPAPFDACRQKGDLWPMFVNGIVDALTPGARLVDGLENAYEYEQSHQEFALAALGVKTRALGLVFPENRARYAAAVQASFGIFLDCYVRPEKTPRYWFGPLNGSRLAHFDDNLFGATYWADEYVWLYSGGQRMSWVKWKGIRGGFGRWPTAEERMPGFTEVALANKDPQAWFARREKALAAEGKLVNLAVKQIEETRFFSDAKTPKKGYYAIEPPDQRAGDWYGFRFRARGEARATVRWGEEGLGRRPKGARVPPVCVSMGAPNADGWRECCGVVRIPADTLKAAIIFNADRERDPTVAYRDFRLYRLMDPNHT